MKSIVLLPVLVLCFCSLKGQKLVADINYYTNSEVNVVTDFSDNSYRITSIWYDDPRPSDIISPDDEDYGIIKWSSGKIFYHKDTLICVDAKTHKKLYFLQKNEDILKIMDWQDYKNKGDKTNWHIGWNDNPDLKVYIGDLLRKNRLFYKTAYLQKNIFTGETTVVRAYSWKNGVKTVVCENGRIINKPKKK